MDVYIHELDQASLSAINSSGFATISEGTLETYQDKMINCVKQLLDYIEPIRRAVLTEQENIGHLVSVISVYYFIFSFFGYCRLTVLCCPSGLSSGGTSLHV